MRKYLILFSTLILGLPANSQVKSISLEDAKLYALEHHIDIKTAGHDIAIAKQQIVETRGMGLPQIDMKGTFNHFINIPVQVVDASFMNPMAEEGETIEFRMGTEFNSSGTFQVNQLLFNGSYIVGLQVSKYYAKFQEEAANITKEDVVFNVIQAYQLAAISKDNLRFADSIVLITEKMVNKQTQFYELGLMVKEDLDQLSYSLLSAKNAALEAKIQYKNAIQLLKLTMGYPMDEEIEIVETTETLLSTQNISHGEIQENLQYGLMQRKIQLSEYNIRNNQFANLPSLYAFFNQTYNAYRNEFNFFEDEKWFPQTLWGLQLNIPVFSGLQRMARTKQAKIALMKDELALEQLERSLKFHEMQTNNNLQGAQDKFNLQKENIVLARTIYENAIAKEQIGKGNSITVTQKHNQLMVAQAQYLGSLMDLFNAQLELDKLYNKILTSDNQ